MKRTRSQRNQHSSPPHVAGNTTTPLMRNQTLFRNHSESVDNAIIRNNNLQLSFSEDQINPERQLSFGAFGGQFRPHSSGLNQHRAAWPAAMNGFAFGGRQFISCPRFFQQNFRSAFNYYTRPNSQRIPRTTRQFQETQRHWNAGFTQQRNCMHTSTISASEINNTGHKANGYLNKRKDSMRRKWQALPEAEQCRPNEFSFSLVTYNMLSDSLLYENMYLYQDCNNDYLSWGYRKEKLLAELLGYEAEILCLQEVDASHYENWFLPKLHEAGYMGLFVQRTGGKPDGCAIFYRHAKFTLVNHKLVRYYTPKVQILDKDNVGIVLLLKANTPDQAENPFICVANTHLLFNKKRGDIKLAQLAYLFAEINELAVLPQDDHSKTHCPVILCGDLNSLPYSPLYHFLINGQLDYSARSPAVISGQLAPSEARRGPSSRQIRTPLLPWEFGVTLDCQWRKEQESKSEGSCAHIQDRDIQESERDIERRRKPEDRSNPSDRCKSTSSIQAADPYRNETLKHVDSNISEIQVTTNTNRYVETNEMKGLKIHRDSKEQPNRGQDEWNKGLGEREVRTQHISQKDGFNRDRKSDRNTEPNRHSECSRVPGSNKYTEQPQRRRDHMGSCSQGSSGTVNLTRESPSPRDRGSGTVNLTRESPSPRDRGSSTVDLTPESPSPRDRGSSTVNLTRESPSPRDRGSSTVNLTRESPSPRDRGSSTVNLTRESPSPRNRGSSTVDLTRESPSPRNRGSSTVDLTRESPSPRNRVAEPSRDSKSNRLGESKLFKDAKLNPDWTVGKSERNSEFIDLTRDTESPRPRNSRAAEENRVGISNRDPDLNRSTESSGHTSRAGEQHSHTSIPAPSSEMQTEETNYNKNRTISIPWQFKSVYTHRFRDGTPEVTTCHSKACCNVDYIFYTAGIRDRRDTKHRKYVQTGQLTLLGRLELMGKTDFNTMRLLPNHIFPSDHLSLQARFKLT